MPDLSTLTSVLVADDDDQLLRLCSRLLTRAGYTVLAAGDGDEALRVFHEHSDELRAVVLDATLPPGGAATRSSPVATRRRRRCADGSRVAAASFSTSPSPDSRWCEPSKTGSASATEYLRFDNTCRSDPIFAECRGSLTGRYERITLRERT